MHSIDIGTGSWGQILVQSCKDLLPSFGPITPTYSEIRRWIHLFKESGVEITTTIPGLSQVLNRDILVESPDVVYRFYPPNNTPKPYRSAASLLLIIEDV